MIKVSDHPPRLVQHKASEVKVYILVVVHRLKVPFGEIVKGFGQVVRSRLCTILAPLSSSI